MNLMEYDINNIKTKFAEDYFMAQMSFDEIKKNLRLIVDNKKTKPRDKINGLKQLSEDTIESLELIPIIEIMLRVEKLNEDLKQRENIILTKEKILKEKQGKDKTKSSEKII
jgi:hypothetical protein